MNNLKSLVVIGAVLATALVARGTTVYDDLTANPIPAPNAVLGLTNNQMVGDQITLGVTTAPYLNDFQIEYYSSNLTAYAGSVTMDVRFYLNDGAIFSPYATAPGSIFYDSGAFSIQPPNYYYPGTNSAVLDFNLSDLMVGDGPGAVGLNPSLQLPTNFTVAVFFQGLSGGDSAGLNMFDPATVGTNYGDYWYDNGGSWELLTNSASVAFGMQLNAQTTPTPEPAICGLTVVGSVLLTAFARRRRK